MIKFKSQSNKLFFHTLIFFFLFLLTLSIRGSGWDGDSIVNIAQFKKIFFSQLFGIPDMGTTPKLLPILIFGSFNFFFDSYSIHWPVMLIISFSLAKASLMENRLGGGNIWFILPFISPALVFNILSADNPALAIAFYMLSLCSFFNKKILISFIFLLLAEFSRPGYFMLMFLTLIFLLSNQTLKFKKHKFQIFLIFTLFFVALTHSLFLYKLAYSNFFEYSLNNWDNVIAEPFISYDHKISLILSYFSGFLVAIFSNNLLPFPFSIGVFIIFLFSFQVIKKNFNILFLQPIIYFPLLFSGLTIGTIGGIEYRNAYILGDIYSISPHLFSTFIPVLLFSLAMFLNKLIHISTKFSGKKLKIKIFDILLNILKNNLKCIVTLRVSLVISLILVLVNGYVLKGIYEHNPINPINETKWISEGTSNKIIQDLFNKKKRRLNILVTCDFIPMLIDNSKFINRISVASDKVFSNNKGFEYLSLCYDEIIAKRNNDIILKSNEKYDIINQFDILYTTNEMLNFFETFNYISIVNLKNNRILLINNK